MDPVTANKLLQELRDSGVNERAPLKGQLSSRFVPAAWGPGIYRRDSFEGRVHSCAQLLGSKTKQNEKVVSAFREAIRNTDSRDPDPILTRLIDELEGAADPMSPLGGLQNRELNELKATAARTTAETELNIAQHSLLGKRCGVDAKISSDTFDELFGFKQCTKYARGYWLNFLNLFRRFQSHNFEQTSLLMTIAKSLNEKIEGLIAGKSVDDNDAILRKEAQGIASQIAAMKTDEAFLFEGSYGAKVRSLRDIFRMVQGQHSLITQMIPDLDSFKTYFDNPQQSVKDTVRKLISENYEKLTEQERQILNLFAEDPSREFDPGNSLLLQSFKPLIDSMLHKGILGMVDSAASKSPSPEVLDLMRLLTHTPGIDSYLVTGMFFYLFSLMKFMPHDQLLEVVRFIGDNNTRFAHPETREEALDELEKLIGSIIDAPFEATLATATEQFDKIVRTLHSQLEYLGLDEIVYETYPNGYPLLHAPYWFKLEKDDEGTYTAYIYSSGHALNYHSHKEGKIQWPMRISHIPEERLGPAFFERLLMHRFKSEYDIDFTSKVEDLWGDKGLFEMLRVGKPSQNPLEWRPYSTRFDNEFELLQSATTTGSREAASLQMHISAMVDYLAPYRDQSGKIRLDGNRAVLAQIESGLKVMLDEYSTCKKHLNQAEQKQVEWTFYELRELLRKTKESNNTYASDETLIPPQLMGWLKEAMLGADISSEHIMQYRHTISWLFGENVAESLDTIFKSADAASSSTNAGAIQGAKASAERRLQNGDPQHIKERLEDLEQNPQPLIDFLDNLEKTLTPLKSAASKRAVQTVLDGLAQNDPAKARFDSYLRTNDPADLNQAIRSLETRQGIPRDANGIPTDATLRSVYTALKTLSTSRSPLAWIQRELDALPPGIKQLKEVKQIQSYLKAFASDIEENQDGLRRKNLDLARILAMRLNAANPQQFGSILEKINELNGQAVQLDTVRKVRFDAKRVQKHIAYDRVHQAATRCFNSLQTALQDDNAIKELHATKRAFSVLNESVVSRSSLRAAAIQLQTLQNSMRAAGIDTDSVEELKTLREQLKNRISIEKSFTPSKGWLRDALATIYVQTVLHLIRLSLALEHLASPVTMIFLYGSLLSIMPKPMADFIDYYLKIVLRYVIEKAFLFTLRTLAEQHFVAPELVERIFTYKDHLDSLSGSFTGKREVRFNLRTPLASNISIETLCSRFDALAAQAPGGALDGAKALFTELGQRGATPALLISASDQLNAIQIPGQQKEIQELRDMVRVLIARDEDARSLLLAFGRFAPFNQIDYALNDRHLTRIEFKQYGLKFHIRNRGKTLQAVNDYRFPGFAIATKQEDPRFKRYGSYLLLENAAGQNKVLIAANSDLQSISWRILKHLGPLSGLLGNAMGLSLFNAPHRGNQDEYFTFDVNAKGHLTSNDPRALAYLASVDALSGQAEAATQTCEQLVDLIKQIDDKELIASIEKMLWPLMLAPTFLEKLFSIEELGNLYRVRQKLLVAIQKKEPDPKSGEAQTSAAIAQALYQDLVDRDNKAIYDREAATLEEREQEEWQLFQSMLRHLSIVRQSLAGDNERLKQIEQIASVALLTPKMGRRFKALEKKYGDPKLNRTAVQYARDWLFASAYSPACTMIGTEGASSASLYANVKMVEKEKPTTRIMPTLYRAARTGADFLDNPIDWKKIAPMMHAYIVWDVELQPETFSKKLLIADFPTWYAVARGEKGDELRFKLVEALKKHRGGWDNTTRALIELLLVIAEAPVEVKLAPATLFNRTNPIHTQYVDKLFPRSYEMEQVLAKPDSEEFAGFFDGLTQTAKMIQSTYDAAKPVQRAANWFAQGPLLGMMGGRTSLLSWAGYAGVVVGSKIAKVFYDEATDTLASLSSEKPAPYFDYKTLRVEEDKAIHDVLGKVYSNAFDASGSFHNGQTPLKLFRTLKGHRNALKKALEQDKAALLAIVNPDRTYASYRKPVTYKELLKAFFKDDLKTICRENDLDLARVEVAMMRLVARETWIAHMDTTLLRIQQLGNERQAAVYNLRLASIREMLQVRRQYDGDTGVRRAKVRRYLCYELEKRRVMDPVLFPVMQQNLQNPNRFENALSKILQPL